ncbi:MAG: hypothetical protein EWV85_11190 [Microcystis aeruginosa Ma_QC_C_20070703_M131]|uniref:Uncharacterized protein n=1 Tax=Microcystis aeruginosa Ma_QC_C_20070703_M131 TaxID=2486263 RepID=A0A551Y0J7_MICAE|nr:MAG: hypothetical protein EWV85_11190 [Microcystis aeruginosa Ma_QC_C_20070703_M131]
MKSKSSIGIVPIFQRNLFNLPKSEAGSALKTFRKISQLTWEQSCQDQGLKWEKINSKKGQKGENLYSFIITQKSRAIAAREGDYLRILSFQSDYALAYQ